MECKSNYTVPVSVGADVSEDLVMKAKKLNIDVRSVVQRVVKKQGNRKDIQRQIYQACEQHDLMVYNNLVDNYPMQSVGIRDCYNKSM